MKMNNESWDLVQKDYHEESVLTPGKWFKTYIDPEKRKEIQHVQKFILTFPYMEYFVEKVKSLDGEAIDWYPQLWTFPWKGEELGLIISPVGGSVYWYAA